MTDALDEGFWADDDERGKAIRFASYAVLNGQSMLRLVANDAVTPAVLLRAIAVLLRNMGDFDPAPTWSLGAVKEKPCDLNILGGLPKSAKLYVESEAAADNMDLGIYLHGFCVHHDVGLDMANLEQVYVRGLMGC